MRPVVAVDGAISTPTTAIISQRAVAVAVASVTMTTTTAEAVVAAMEYCRRDGRSRCWPRWVSVLAAEMGDEATRVTAVHGGDVGGCSRRWWPCLLVVITAEAMW